MTSRLCTYRRRLRHDQPEVHLSVLDLSMELKVVILAS